MLGLISRIDGREEKAISSIWCKRKRNMRLYFFCCLVLSLFVFLICHVVLPNKLLSVLPDHETVKSPIRSQYNLIKESFQALPQTVQTNPCDGRRVFMYDLPSKFNADLLQKCEYGVVSWLNFCYHASNDGLGQSHENVSEETSMGKGWYNTDAYMLEVIFHSRMRRYSCLTNNSEAADAFFVPYYTGIDALRYLYAIEKKNVHMDKHGADLVAWLEHNGSSRWQQYAGKDHFMVMGRTSWDFVYSDAIRGAGWGTGISHLPHIVNMSTLLIEKRPWAEHEQAVPYPTSFHPSFSELQTWINKVRNAKRPYLFAFAGGMRPTMQDTTIRTRLLIQCSKSVSCMPVDCGKLKCSHNPKPIATAFLQSEFCLQPRGDTPTRRSAFDAMIAGCIPVFFHEDSAYTQYTWHLPKDPDSYSVFISEEDVRNGLQIERLLKSYSQDRIRQMRNTISEVMPKLLYVNPYSAGKDFNVTDAFDISIAGVLQRISKLKQQLSKL
ncbi:hypothetical protein O6H91_12G014000 [Diphasiastrum complanatum]|uniref:Uncharacterized protein n=1 Tax=Diphasiastrum complanatum TaxID=34168 RepID=A0ACC2BYZ2_DIPCM|nr:hypothetical protein O6H91_12G014000 [Diphasiastrum complanatum]